MPTRIQRARMPRAAQVAREAALEVGVCIRPVPLRRIDLDTGETTIVDIPCGSTREDVCPTCAAKARALRAQQCREGWHLTVDPDLTPDPSTDEQRALAAERAQITTALHEAELAHDAGLLDAITESADDVDAALADAGVRGTLDPAPRLRRARSTRRRQDAPDLPVRPSNGSTLGRTYTDPKTGRTFRPSTFLTVTLPSYGPIRAGEGTPVNPATYDYARAARDALHFSKLLDRLVQNLRRVAGYDVQYFAAIEPQRRLAPHAHFAIRGTLPRALVRDVLAATYHHVWWPPTNRVIYDGNHMPVWDPTAGDDGAGAYTDPDTGVPLPTWEQALDAIGPDDDPSHVVRFGDQADVQGVLGGTSQADHYISYLTKYLTKSLGGAQHHATQDGDDGGAAAGRMTAHRDRLVDALRHEPCSPTCANWLRYGVQPKNARPGMTPGACRSKAHKPTHLGHAGRRVLVSRAWTGKNLTDHRADRLAHVHTVLGLPDPGTDTSPDQPRIAWEYPRPTDSDIPPLSRRLLLSIAHAHQRRTQYRAARDNLPELSATAPHPTSTGQETAA